MKVDLLGKILLAKGVPAIQDGHLVIGTTVVDGNGALGRWTLVAGGRRRGGYLQRRRQGGQSARKPEEPGGRPEDGPGTAGHDLWPGGVLHRTVNVGGISFSLSILPIRDSADGLLGRWPEVRR